LRCCCVLLLAVRCSCRTSYDTAVGAATRGRDGATARRIVDQLSI
jgi:hypothetical protein